MSKFAFPVLAAAMAGTVLILPSEPAQAQSNRIAEIIVYGDDPCPRSTDDEIVVCARKPEAERYRIPERFRTGGPRQSREAWVNRARSLETVGATGIMSCSPVGPGGFTGCLNQLIKQADQSRGEATQNSTPPVE